MTDATLIRRARQGDADAWNTLARRYLPLAWRYAYALLRDSHSAEDVVSESMMALLKNIRQIDTDAAKISAWLRAVVRHKVADHHRRVYRAKTHLPHLENELRHRHGSASVDAANPDAALLTMEAKTQIVKIMECLSERQRLALEWKYVEGLRVKEIASRLGETEKAVEATLYRARREFRRLYELSETEEAAVISIGSKPNGSLPSVSGHNLTVEYPWHSPNPELPQNFAGEN